MSEQPPTRGATIALREHEQGHHHDQSVCPACTEQRKTEVTTR